MKLSPILAALFATSLALTACNSTAGPNQGAIRFQPPSTEFVERLGITGPVNAEQAKAIAAEAAGGTAISVTTELEDGVNLFEVKVDTSSGRMEVEVRESDGAVVEIEPDDGD